MIDGSAPRYPLDGARVAVLGASGGPGGAIAHALTSRGARLLLSGRDPGAFEASRHPGSADRGGHPRSLVRNAIAEAASEASGRLDGLVNAAGVVAFGSLAEHDDDTIEELFLTNAMGLLWLVRGVLPLLQASEGFVVQLSAVAAEQPLPGMAVYAATKAALTAADAALVRELRRVKVRVSTRGRRTARPGSRRGPSLGSLRSCPGDLPPPPWPSESCTPSRPGRQRSPRRPFRLRS